MSDGGDVGLPAEAEPPTWAELAARYEDRRADAVRAFAVAGAVEEASAVVGVPVGVLRVWSEEAWWKEAVVFHRSDADAVLRARLAAIARKALHEIEDRLENGDERMDRHGDIHRVKVTGKDAAVIAGIAMSARAAMDRAAAPESSETVSALLDTLRRVGKRVGVTIDAAPQPALSQPEAQPHQ